MNEETPRSGKARFKTSDFREDTRNQEDRTGDNPSDQPSKASPFNRSNETDTRPLRFIAQIEYCRNFIFKRHFPIHKIFERSCEIGLWRMTANRISEIFGVRLTQKLRGKLATVIEQIDHGHHVFRVKFKNALLRQYEKFSRFLRNE